MDHPFQARVDDAVGHSEEFFGQVVGFGVGIVLCAALIIGGVVAAPFSGGMSLAASIIGVIGLLAICEASAGAGGFLAGLADPTKTGKIKSGARSVFVGPARKAAARETDPVACEDTMLATVATATVLAVVSPALIPLTPLFAGSHEPAEILSGSKTVRIEGKRAARVTSKLDCDGVVCEGEPTVFTYGEPGTSGKPIRIGWVPWLFGAGLEVIKWGSMLVGNPRAILQQGIRYLTRFGLRRGAPILLRRGLRYFTRGPWGRRVLRALGIHDAYSPIFEALADRKEYNFVNDLYGVGGNDDVQEGAKRLGRRILRRGR